MRFFISISICFLFSCYKSDYETELKKNQLLTEKFQELKADYQSYRSAMDSGEVHLADTEQSSLKSKTGDSYLIKV
ncbi:MAG: hypothetical protein KDD94_03230, partial [Calditrichaeota bacterium]|nr:hypothetical protein [Calditrichota bacterium]